MYRNNVIFFCNIFYYVSTSLTILSWPGPTGIIRVSGSARHPTVPIVPVAFIVRTAEMERSLTEDIGRHAWNLPIDSIVVGRPARTEFCSRRFRIRRETSVMESLKVTISTGANVMVPTVSMVDTNTFVGVVVANLIKGYVQGNNKDGGASTRVV